MSRWAIAVLLGTTVWACAREPVAPSKVPAPKVPVRLPGVDYRLYYIHDDPADYWHSIPLNSALDTLVVRRGVPISMFVMATPSGALRSETASVMFMPMEPVDCRELPKHDGLPLRVNYSADDSTAVFPQTLRFESQTGSYMFGRLPADGYLTFEAWGTDVGDYLPKSPPIWIEVRSSGSWTPVKGPHPRDGGR